MGKSARVLGEKYGLTDQEMNYILKEEGFLDGEPGNYTVTKKGEKFAGDGKTSYGRINGNWTTRTWDDGIADELDIDKRDITEDRKREIRQAISRAKRKTNESDDEGLAIECASYSTEDAYTTDANYDALVEAVSTLLVAVSVYGLYKATPYVRRWWSEKAVPSLKKMKSKVTDEAQEMEEEPDSDSLD